MSFVLREEEVEWLPHPIATGVKVKPLLTKRDNSVDVTCMLVFIKKNLGVQEHVHQEQDDIIYPLSGKGKIWVDNLGELDLTRGMIIKVCRGTRHKIYNVTEDLLLFDVFSPATI